MKNKRPVHGIILLDKPLGLSSNQALQRVKYLFHAEKAGHTGSLDPLATGMLPLCLADATKFSQYMLDADKTYLTTARLGQVTTTGDSEGEILKERAVPPLDEAILKTCINTFLGEQYQVPPMFSALKHQGKPLYELARQGINIEREPRKIMLYDLALITFTKDSFELRVKCSKGTYIRTLVEDIGEKLGCGAHVIELRRESIAGLESYPLQSIADIEAAANKDDLLLPVDLGLKHYPIVELNSEDCLKIQHGQAIHFKAGDIGLVRLYTTDKKFIGLGEFVAGFIKPKRLCSKDIVL